MIHYVVVVGAPDAVARFAPRLRGALDRTRILTGEHVEEVERVATTGAWAAAAISAPDATASGRFVADGDELMVLNGPALALDGDQTRLVPNVLRAFRAGGTDAVVGALGGAFNFVGFTPEHGLRAYADFSGLYPLYWHQGADFAVFSNRSTTVARVIGTSGWDVRALAWIIGHASLWGDRLPARGASYLQPAQEARADADGRVHTTPCRSWVWPAPTEHAGRDDLTPSEWDDVTEALLANWRVLKQLDEPMSLFLSGGRDSRLCLALAKAAGLQDRIVTLTTGVWDSPEFLCAEAVAEAAGFCHRRHGAPGPTEAPNPQFPASDFVPSLIWRRLRQAAYRYESMLCPWDGAFDSGSTALNIKGFGREVYRGPGGHARQFRERPVTTLDEMADRFVHFHGPHDPLRVLQPDEARFQAMWLRRWAYMSAEQIRFDVLPEKFYFDYRVGHWNGTMCQSRPTHVQLVPLVLGTVAKKNFELSVDARNSERLHYEVMRRTAPELAALPFVNAPWSDAVAAGSKLEVAREIFPSAVKANPRTLRSWQWKFVERESDAIDELFADASDTEMSSICDMARLRAAARDPEQLRGVQQAKTILSAVGVALTLLERTEPWTDSVDVTT